MFHTEPNAKLMIAVISDNGSLLIYDHTTLVWAAQLSVSSPVAIQRSNIHGLPGAIVTLNRKGTVNVAYLGSDPHVFKAPPLDLKQLDFQRAHSELTELEKQIQQGVDYSGKYQTISNNSSRYLHKNLNISRTVKIRLQIKIQILYLCFYRNLV